MAKCRGRRGALQWAAHAAQLRSAVSRFGSALSEFCDSASMVPIRNEDVCIGINEAAVRCAEHARLDVGRIEFIIRPLQLLRIIAQKSNWCVVSIQNGNAAFQFRNHSIMAVKADLAWPPQVLGHGADVFAIKVEMAQAPVFAIAYQQQGLIIAQVKSETVRTVELPFMVSFLREASLVIAIPVETENPRVSVAIGDEYGTVRRRNRSGKAPLIGSLKTTFGRSGDFQYDGAVDLHLYKQPVLRGRAFLHGGVEELLSVFFGVNHRMNFGIGIRYGPDQAAIAVVDEHSGCTLRADVGIASLVLSNCAMRPSKACPRGQRSPARHNFVGPLAISSQDSCRCRLVLFRRTKG